MSTQPTPSEPRYPGVTVQLTGNDGNAYVALGAVRKAMRRAGCATDDIAAFTAEATSGDYDNLLRSAMRWVDVA